MRPVMIELSAALFFGACRPIESERIEALTAPSVNTESREGWGRSDTKLLKYTDLPGCLELRPSHLTRAN
jgi:hypothetical protein